jgi:hypothetical protein
MRLGVSDSVPAINTPGLSNLLQGCFWCRSKAREEQVGDLKRLAVASAGCLHRHDPAGAGPGLIDMLRVCLASSIQAMSRPWLIS